jgi:hypothetical protein
MNKITIEEVFNKLNEIESKYDCRFDYYGGRTGTIWFHQSAGPSIAAAKELKEVGIPVRTVRAAFDKICGRYYVGFSIPKHLNVEYEGEV